ncbi:hypothetical protein [Variovorax sp. CY25R-8]|uniref:hypothetical protein n=1 Tax=Variovorax sp. CY25R-8 TaxID=2855501 RepID=UPI0021BBA465|nr:hypothetical protein [Variovorax sp. CY25R-8]MCT8173938.1 hypothetical protein [Variovorax sp. CY25R-8]
MSHLTILSINWLSDGEDADVTLSSDVATVVAFCFQCSYKVGQTVPNLLHPVMVDELESPYLQDWPTDEKALAGAERLECHGSYGYRGCGEVVDQAEGLVQACGFVFDFGDVPAGAEIVRFQFDRLDLW